MTASETTLTEISRDRRGRKLRKILAETGKPGAVRQQSALCDGQRHRSHTGQQRQSETPPPEPARGNRRLNKVIHTPRPTLNLAQNHRRPRLLPTLHRTRQAKPYESSKDASQTASTPTSKTTTNKKISPQVGIEAHRSINQTHKRVTLTGSLRLPQFCKTVEYPVYPWAPCRRISLLRLNHTFEFHSLVFLMAIWIDAICPYDCVVSDEVVATTTRIGPD